MCPTSHRPLAVESLEDRSLLSATAGLIHTPILPGHARPADQGHHHLQRHEHMALVGRIQGMWSDKLTMPDAGTSQVLTGSGVLAPLGLTLLAGELHTPGFIANGHMEAQLVLSNEQGSLTVQLTATETGFDHSATTVDYRIVSGTGHYANAAGHGKAVLNESPDEIIIRTPGGMVPMHVIAHQFTLTFEAPEHGRGVSIE